MRAPCPPYALTYRPATASRVGRTAPDVTGHSGVGIGVVTNAGLPSFKYLAAPLSPAQLDEVIQIPGAN
ncbi:MAG: hypothetical protein JOZ94_24925 [Xanthobacteraceae bacterium]|nr:hypothetical protein [Xanthobacteraceae bacterium]